MTTTVRDHVVAIISRQLGLEPEEITDDSRFVDDLGADSLDTVELVMDVEDEILDRREIPDEVAERWTTVGQAVAGITELLHDTRKVG